MNIYVINNKTKKIGRLQSTDVDFFPPDTVATRRNAATYTPTFVEDIIASSPQAAALNVSCNYVQSCVADALVSGLTKFGQATGSTITSNVDADNKLSTNFF